MNLWLALGAWIGVSVPVALALGIVLGHAKGTAPHQADRILRPVSGGRLTRV